MRGCPPIQIALLVIAFAALAVPLKQLTGHPPPVLTTSAPQKKSAAAVKTLLRLRYAHKPTQLSLKIDGKEFISTIQGSPIEVAATLLNPKDGVEMFLNATWPDHTPDTAITIEVEPDGLETQSETRWSSASSLDEVIPFSWQ